MAVPGDLTQPLPDQPSGQATGDDDPVTGPDTARSALLELTMRLEDEHRLDPIVVKAAAIVQPVLGTPSAKALLGGRWMGHALHPLMTDIPIGFWTSATVLDVIGGRRSAAAAQRLIGLGVLSAVPTAATGWSDWLSLDRSLRRVGVVHAASNSVALLLFAWSWLARRKGHRFRGIVLGFAAGTVASGAGHLGGHMTVGRGAGVAATRDALAAEPRG